MADDRIHSFEDFWPHYVRAHSKRANRTLHFAGTSAAMLLATTGLVTGRVSLLLAAPVVGYGCAWLGHLVLEGNKPATFGHPMWSLAADFVMWKKILDGTMDAEVDKHRAPIAEAQARAAPAQPSVVN